MISVKHKRCGNIAFYFKEILRRGDVIHSSNVILLDGTTPEWGSKLICGTCHGQVDFHTNDLEQIEQCWKDWFIINK